MEDALDDYGHHKYSYVVAPSIRFCNINAQSMKRVNREIEKCMNFRAEGLVTFMVVQDKLARTGGHDSDEAQEVIATIKAEFYEKIYRESSPFELAERLRS